MISVYYGTDPFESVQALLDDLNPFAALPPNTRAVIKPNIVVEKENWLGADTRPQTVEAVVIRLRERGVTDITVADGSGVGHSATAAFRVLGYDTIAEKYGVKLLDIEKDDFVIRKTRCKGPFNELRISRTVAECDYLINIPVLKAHGETKLTCSLKNLKGVMPREMKPRFHSVDLHQAIAQLNSLVAADFILVDGGYGDLSSEMGGTPVEMGIMAAGTDPLEIDAFAASTLGYRPEDIRHLNNYAHWRKTDLKTFSSDIKRLNKPEKEQTFTPDRDPFRRLPCAVISEGACCTCRGAMTFALKRLSDKGILKRNLTFLNGRRGIENIDGTTETVIAVGQCAIKQARQIEKDSGTIRVISVPGCPPETGTIMEKAGI